MGRRGEELVFIEKLQIDELRNTLKRTEESFLSQQDTELNQKLRNIAQKRNNIKLRESKALAAALEKFQGDFLSSHFSSYSISADAHSIFHDQYAAPDVIVRNLANHGIRTAADFSGISATGAILTATGRSVKVPQVGGYRAERLEAWRRAKMRNAPNTVPQVLPHRETNQVKQQCKAEYDQLQLQERAARTEAINRKANVPAALINQRMEADNKEQLLGQELDKQKNTTKLRYTSQRQALSTQFNSLKQEYR